MCGGMERTRSTSMRTSFESRRHGSTEASGHGLSHLGGERVPPTKGARSVTANEADELALHLDAVGPEDARLIGWIGGFQRDGVTLAPQALESCLLVIDKSDDDLSRLSLLCFADDDRIALQYAGLD